MSRKIQSSRGSSISFAATPHAERRAEHAAWEVRPSRSRLLTAWRVVVHALAIASIVLCGLAWPLKLATVSVLLAHALLRRTPAPMPVACDADGYWALPSLGLDRLMLQPGTAVGPFWVHLMLGSAGRRSVTVLLLADQVDRESWRRLQAALRGRTQPGTV